MESRSSGSSTTTPPSADDLGALTILGGRDELDQIIDRYAVTRVIVAFSDKANETSVTRDPIARQQGSPGRRRATTIRGHRNRLRRPLRRRPPTDRARPPRPPQLVDAPEALPRSRPLTGRADHPRAGVRAHRALIKLDSPAPSSSGNDGWAPRTDVPNVQVQDDGRRRRAAKEELAHLNKHRNGRRRPGMFKIVDDPRVTRVGRSSGATPSTSCRS